MIANGDRAVLAAERGIDVGKSGIWDIILKLAKVAAEM